MPVFATWLLLCLPVFTTSLPVWGDNRESHLDFMLHMILYLRKLSAELLSRYKDTIIIFLIFQETFIMLSSPFIKPIQVQFSSWNAPERVS